MNCPRGEAIGVMQIDGVEVLDCVEALGMGGGVSCRSRSASICCSIQRSADVSRLQSSCEVTDAVLGVG